MVVVRPVDEAAADQPRSPDDVLSRPAEELGFDPFEEPLV
jgi:hypothetical protein